MFVLSIGTYIAVKVLYNFDEPIMPLEIQIVPYYLNMIVSSSLIYFGYVLFKPEHLRYEQKEALLPGQNQMAGLLAARTRKLMAQNKDMIKYTFLNSHKARSPIACILGLVNLTKFEDLDTEEKWLYYF